MTPIIQVTDLSKLYTITHEGRERYTNLRDVIARKTKKIFSFPSASKSTSHSKEEFWALKDICFEINPGDRVGIIGRNGAGKSTLLKILSRITEPTTGKINIKGRVSSLLEVGTGFHPELTGRENIFLNGAILGMSRVEIKKHFDAIVDFAEIEKFLDTPVKRYSSGMYVRLAFAVAAHLEPEILIVDEVLAVGDAEFQAKCLGKMKDVSTGEGRTVIFVSHNIAAISTLCTHSIILNKGLLDFNGSVNQGVEKYINSNKISTGTVEFDGFKHHKCTFSRLKSVQLVDESGNIANTFFIGRPLKINVKFELFENINNLEIGLGFSNIQGTSLFSCISPWENFQTNFTLGEHLVECIIPFLPTLPNSYTVTAWVKKIGEGTDDEIERAIGFEVLGRSINAFNPYFDKYVEFNLYQPSKWHIAD